MAAEKKNNSSAAQVISATSSASRSSPSNTIFDKYVKKITINDTTISLNKGPDSLDPISFDVENSKSREKTGFFLSNLEHIADLSDAIEASKKTLDAAPIIETIKNLGNTALDCCDIIVKNTGLQITLPDRSNLPSSHLVHSHLVHSRIVHSLLLTSDIPSSPDHSHEIDDSKSGSAASLATSMSQALTSTTPPSPSPSSSSSITTVLSQH